MFQRYWEKIENNRNPHDQDDFFLPNSRETNSVKLGPKNIICFYNINKTDKNLQTVV